MKSLLVLSVLAASLACAHALAQQGAHAAAHFAEVDGTTISAAEYDAALKNTVRQKFYHREVPEAKLDEFRREVAETLIDRLLLIAEARRRGIAADAARVAGQIAEYDQRYGQSEHWKKSRDATLPGLTKFLEERDILEQLQASVRVVEPPGEPQLAAYYGEHPELFTEPEQVRLSVILLKVDPSSPPASWALALDEAQGIHRRLAAGADFAALARLHSTDASAPSGGDMGYLHQGMIPEALYAQIGAMKPGDLSQPIRLLQGVAVFRLEDRRSAKLRELAEVRERAVQLWQRAEGERRWSDLLARLRAAAAIRIDTARYPALAGLFPAAPGAPRSE